MKILFLISEVEDIIKTGGLADVGKALPIELAKLGHEVVVMMPYYKQVAEQMKLANAMPSQILHVGEQSYQFDVKALTLHGLQVYLIDHSYFSQQSQPYSDDGNSSEKSATNAQRFSFFSLACLHVSHELHFKPDVVHTHDWHTAMAAYFLKSDFCHRHSIWQDEQFFANASCIITLHNAAFQCVCELSKVPILDAHSQQQVYTDNAYVNLLKTGISYADKVCAVSPTYAKEIRSHIGSHGIDDVINQAPEKVHGILNGCDYSQWDPEKDPLIPANFNAKDLSGKAVCKSKLQQQSGLKRVKSVPLIGMVCRATRQKGFDYLMPILDELLAHKVQLVIMGTGEPYITRQLHDVAAKHAGKFSFIEAFSSEWAHLIEAGSDFFLMPSEFEPCGLNQMYSLAYGTLPIVRRVGGLADTVVDVNEPNSNGFAFNEPSSLALINCLRKTLLVYNEQAKLIAAMRQRAFASKFTWRRAAQEYVELYCS
uniref:glycogen synthase n=1 Tax=Ningiella ruwaisensis TaxID=2364274 RepID=UPI00109F3166|nr:glycogen synthase [Ningiella ruwaisensis]